MNRVRGIVRVCHKFCPKGRGIDSCFGSCSARNDEYGCQWRAELMHPLDEPENLQKLVPSDVPVKVRC